MTKTLHAALGLALLAQADHGPAFHEMVNRYPLTERARGYLLAIDQGAVKALGV